MSLAVDNHTVDQAIGARVRALRQARRLSLEELGRRVGVTYQQVQKYETGSNRVAASTLLLLAAALNVAAVDLLGSTEADEISAEARMLARRLDQVKVESRPQAFAAVTNIIGAIEGASA